MLVLRVLKDKISKLFIALLYIKGLTYCWCVVGDFNETLRQQDKWGGKAINRLRSSRFWTCVNNCNLIDLGFKGSRYTYSNHWKRTKGLILERIDRCFVSNEWLEHYPNVFVTHLPKSHSDHNPLIINLCLKSRSIHNKPFRLESYWLEHHEFKDILSNSWLNRDLTSAANHFKDNVINWSSLTFGDIFQKKEAFS